MLPIAFSRKNHVYNGATTIALALGEKSQRKTPLRRKEMGDDETVTTAELLDLIQRDVVYPTKALLSLRD